MSFFDVMKRLLPHASHATANDETRQRIRAAWGLEDEAPSGSPADQGPSLAENRGALGLRPLAVGEAATEGSGGAARLRVPMA